MFCQSIDDPMAIFEMIYFESVVNSALLNVLDDSSNFNPDDTSGVHT